MNLLKGNGYCLELSLQKGFQQDRGFWFVLFCLHFVFQLFLMLNDWRRDIHYCCTSATGILRFLFITSWLDWTIIAMMISVVFLNTKALWTILTILLIMFGCREAFQMSVSLKRYFFTPENWIEGLLIVFGKILIFLGQFSMKLYKFSICFSWNHIMGTRFSFGKSLQSKKTFGSYFFSSFMGRNDHPCGKTSKTCSV